MGKAADSCLFGQAGTWVEGANLGCANGSGGSPLVRVQDKPVVGVPEAVGSGIEAVSPVKSVDSLSGPMFQVELGKNLVVQKPQLLIESLESAGNTDFSRLCG